jgi:hypothetical protein
MFPAFKKVTNSEPTFRVVMFASVETRLVVVRLLAE